MIKRTRDEFLGEFSEIKSMVKVSKKMYKEGYKDEIKILKKLEKLLLSGISGNEPVTQEHYSLSILAILQEFKRIINTQNMQNQLVVKNIEKTLVGVLAVNGIIEIIGELAKESKLKTVQKKLMKMQKFQDEILSKVKQKQKSKPDSKHAYIGVR